MKYLLRKILLIISLFTISLAQVTVSANYKPTSFSNSIKEKLFLSESQLTSWLNLELSNSVLSINESSEKNLIKFISNVGFPKIKYSFNNCKNDDCRHEFSKKINSNNILLHEFGFSIDSNKLTITLSLFNTEDNSIQNSIPGEVVFEADDIVSSFEIEMLVRQEIRNLLDLLLPGAFFSEDKEIEILDFLDNKSFDNVEKLNLEQKSISVFRDQYSKFQVLQKDKSNYNLSYKISNSPKNGSLILDDKFIYFIPNSSSKDEVVDIDYYIFKEFKYEKIGTQKVLFKTKKPIDKKPRIENQTFNITDYQNTGDVKNSFILELNDAKDDGRIISYDKLTDPAFGTMKKLGMKTFEYLPDAKFIQSNGNISLIDSFSFNVTDNGGNVSDTAIVTIDIQIKKTSTASQKTSKPNKINNPTSIEKEDDEGGSNMTLILVGVLLLVLLAAGGGGGGDGGGSSGGGPTGGIGIGINLP